MTPSLIKNTLVLGGILEESTYDDNVHVGHVLFAIALWAVMIYGIERIVQKNEKVNRWVITQRLTFSFFWTIRSMP